MTRALLLLLLLCAGCPINRALWRAPELPADAEKLEATTSDGWKIALVHYKPHDPLPGRRPLLLVHGIVTNARNLDFDEHHSMARWFASHGIDTWTMSLRGHGESTHAALFGGKHRFDWDFDTYCTLDLPAAVAKVRALTGAARIDLVGHSMGGMLLYCLLARGGDAAGIGAGATLGSPIGFRWGPRFTKLAHTAAALGAKAPVLSLNSGALLALPLLSWYPEPSQLLFFNEQNIDKELWSRFLSVGVEDESPALARQFLRFLDTDRFTSRDGSIDYEAGLHSVHTPLLVVAGKVDQLGFPPLVRRAYDALPTGAKAWQLVGEENGASADYGHMDLVLGDRAADDVFVWVEKWLAAHSR